MGPELLATHQILSLFEQSKLLADDTLDSLPGLYLNFDRRGSILRTNKVLSNLTGINHEDFLGRKIAQVFSPGFWEEIEKKVPLLYAENQNVMEFECSIEFNAKKYDYIWQVTPLKGLGGEKEVFAVTGRDITETKKAMARVISAEKNLELTGQVQSLLLPEVAEYAQGTLQIAACYLPADSAGGDYWRVEFIDDDKTWIFMGDVTGHGVGAAMVVAMVTGVLNVYVGAKRDKLFPVTLPMMLQSVGNRLHDLRNNPYWMTFLALEINTAEDKVYWWSAAAPPTIVVTPGGKAEHSDFRSSSPLGSPSFALSNGEYSFTKGSRLIVLTDGIYEAENPKGRQFGGRKIIQYFEATKGQPPTQAREGLLKTVSDWQDGGKVTDDYTFMIIDRLK